MFGSANTHPIKVVGGPDEYHYFPSDSISVGSNSYVHVKFTTGRSPVERLTRAAVVERIKNLLDEGHFIMPQYQSNVPPGSDPIIGITIDPAVVAEWKRLGIVQIVNETQI